jgi:CubicO group peptidase (beta-lactamase class C family)
MSSAAEIAHALVEEGVSSQAAAGCAIRVGTAFRTDLGGDADVYFDLASLTKPMTAVAIGRSGLRWEATLSEVVEELASTASSEASLLALLSHRAGLLAHVSLFAPLLVGLPLDVGRAIRQAADARRPECRGAAPPGGFPPVYSDLGYILAGVALARHTGGLDAGQCILDLVSAPLQKTRELGTARSLEALGIELTSRAAPTEDVPWRGGVVRGRVHDENAWALTREGGSGHAGMFGTVAGVLEFGCGVLDALSGRGPFADADVAELTRERHGGTLRAGFDGRSDRGSSAGESFGPRAFGHLGFTGTSLWIDPEREVVVVLLTNRVHPSRGNQAIRTARPRAHDALLRRALELERRARQVSPGS